LNGLDVVGAALGNSYVPPVSGAELGSANVGARWAGPLTRGAGFFFCMVFSFFLVSWFYCFLFWFFVSFFILFFIFLSYNFKYFLNLNIFKFRTFYKLNIFYV
jgi:hypothetical protein